MSDTGKDIILDDIVKVEPKIQKRIAALDVSRGVAMIFIMALHFGLTWLDESSICVAAATQIIFEFMGPSMFVILSSISVVFTVKRKQETSSEKAIRMSIFMRGFTVMALGMVMNLTTLNIWGWSILMFIGFGQIFTYYAQKIDVKLRIAIGLSILLITEPVREFFWMYSDANLFNWVMNFIISSPVAQFTLLPWLSVCFLAPVIGEQFYKVLVEGTEEAYRKLFKNMMIVGVICVVVGILLGLELKRASGVYYEMYEYLELLKIWNHQNIAQVPGLQKFLLTGTTSGIFYHMGCDLLLIGGIFYLLDIKKKDNLFVDMLKYNGKASLNLFLIEYIFISLFHLSLSLFYWIFIALSFLGFLPFLLYIWEKYADSVGTPEWLFGLALGGGKKKPEQVINR